MSRFYFGSESNSSASDNDDDSLPYPEPLPRSDFLDPDFTPSKYLSSLHNRHQTLEDLRSELRSRSQLLSKELVDLVNSNYQDFLGLGRSLQGGDEKVEEVRMAFMGFKRNVEAIRKVIADSAQQVDELVETRVRIKRDIAKGRMLLDVDARLAELEGKLMVAPGTEDQGIGAGDSESESAELSDDEDMEDTGVFISLSKLQRHVQQYLYIQLLMEESGLEHPYIVAQQPRMMKIKNTLLLDLGAVLKQAKAVGDRGTRPLLKVMALYRDLDEGKEAVRMFKSMSSR